MNRTTTIELDGPGVAFRFAHTTETGPLGRAPLGGGLTGVMPLAKGLEVLLGMVITAANVVNLIGVLGA